MKKSTLAISTAVVILSVAAFCQIASASTQPAWSQSIIQHHTLIDGETVNYVTINVHNPKVCVMPVVANNQFGTTASLANMAKSAHAVVAINGTFFNSWSNDYPSGAIEINGQFESDSEGTILGFGNNGQMLMARAKESLSANIEDQSNPSVTGLWPWYLNVPSENSDRVDILTSFYGKTTKDSRASVVDIEGNRVLSIHQGITTIPSNGFAVELGSNESSMLNRIHAGDPASLSVSVDGLNGDAINFSAYPNAIGAGPMLVNGGQIVLNPSLEGFKDPTLIDTNTLRSFAGIDNKGDLVLGTIHSATLATEARIVQQLGLRSGMNLDGGSSTGLYMNGQYITSPGRNLATSLVVTYK
ncbi:phosphodiester glycosidase family protein [Alicyclobacillus fodiniaquatilis]|uniref:Phosphodiester glycosidase family protein n=1 Tax=Alicyclobacillus fodiniaquatilis TaxID=1661150 RepID=A0ABW4JG15_9BACL